MLTRGSNLGTKVFKVFVFVTLYFEANFTITPEEVTRHKLPLQYDHGELICVDILPLCKVTWLSLSSGVLTNRGAPSAQLVECRTRDRKVMGLNLTRGAVLCPWARHFLCIAYYWFNPGKHPDILKKNVDLDVNPNKQTITMQLLFEVICIISICFQASLPLTNMFW